MYTNQPIVDARKPNPYTDTPSPRVFGNTSALDPQLFSTCNGFADELLKRDVSGKYSPLEVAQWLEDFADAAATRIVQADRALAGTNSADYKRVSLDVHIEAGIGRFFGAKLRAAVLYRIHEKSGSRSALEEAIKLYKRGRDIWSNFASAAKGEYAADVTLGEHLWLRGHWLDRVAAMDDDIADMSKRLEAASGAAPEPEVQAAISEAMGRPVRADLPCTHTAPAHFTLQQDLKLELRAKTGAQIGSARLHYRHVNQGERFQSVEMAAKDGVWSASIPSAYTDSPYPLEYYFEVKPVGGRAGLFPGFRPDLTNQPYFVVRQSGAKA
jgi:hypothetical protein